MGGSRSHRDRARSGAINEIRPLAHQKDSHDLGTVVGGQGRCVHNFTGGTEDQALRCVRQLLQRSDLKADALEKRQRLLDDTIDVTAFLVSYFESGEVRPPNPDPLQRR